MSEYCLQFQALLIRRVVNNKQLHALSTFLIPCCLFLLLSCYVKCEMEGQMHCQHSKSGIASVM